MDTEAEKVSDGRTLKTLNEAVTHQRGSPQEDGSLLAYDDAFISHSGYISTSGSAGAHNNSNLTEAETGEVGEASKFPQIQQNARSFKSVMVSRKKKSH